MFYVRPTLAFSQKYFCDILFLLSRFSGFGFRSVSRDHFCWLFRANRSVLVQARRQFYISGSWVFSSWIPSPCSKSFTIVSATDSSTTIHLWDSGFPWAFLGLGASLGFFGILWAFLGLSVVLWGSLGFSGPLWPSVYLSGRLWASRGLSRLLWASVALSGLFCMDQTSPGYSYNLHTCALWVYILQCDELIFSCVF